jgi:beta-lactam-binding protein with PASTA domain
LALLTCSACGGSGKTVVPDLRGKTIPQALRLLAVRHLCPSRQIAIEGLHAGRLPIVVHQDPPSGAQVDRGAYITVSVHARESGTLVFYDAPPCN